MNDFKMTARIESKGRKHAAIGVFQNGDKLGVLIVQENYAGMVVDRIQGTDDTRTIRLVAALEEIAKGEGRYNSVHLKHAENTIDDMKQLALDAVDHYKSLIWID